MAQKFHGFVVFNTNRENLIHQNFSTLATAVSDNRRH